MSQILRNAVVRAGRGYVTPGTVFHQQPRSFISTNRNILRCNNKGPVAEKAAEAKASPAFDGASLRNAYRPNRFEQRMLVWTKKYKAGEVPTHVK